MKDRSYWLVGYNFGGDSSQLDRFIEGCYWDGSGTDAVNKQIEKIKPGDILILKTSFTKGENHKTPSLRITKIAIATSESMLMDDGNYRVSTRYVDIDPKEYDGNKYGHYRQTAHECTDKAIIKYVNQYLYIDKSQNMEPAKSQISKEAQLLVNGKNLILTGAPGTGKTFLAHEIAKELGSEGERVQMVQFHPSYDYTDFVEGIRPTEDGKFIRMDGVFKTFCKKALMARNKHEDGDESPKFVFIIDEINRGEISKIFGELFFSIDPGYRGDSSKSIETQYQNMVPASDLFANGFFVPDNVYIIGTMNDIDRSVESMDFAIRRRFTWKEILPEDRIGMWDGRIDEWKEDAHKRMNSLNKLISSDEVGLSSEYCIGPAYFLNIERYNGGFNKLWEMHLEPLLKEYLRGSRDISENLKKLKDAYNNDED